jgi:23S rRNA (guanosine2251-2'-O)-methyltransferase
MREWIYGRNAVAETLLARRRHPFKLEVAEGVQIKGRLSEIMAEAEARKVLVEQVARGRLDQRVEGHQGVMLEVSGYPYTEMADMLDLAQSRGEPPFLLLLDTLKNPQNLGTLLRTAEIVGVHGVLLPLRQTATITPAVVNASSGASEHLLVGQANLAQRIATLKDAGVWVIGLEGSRAAQTPDRLRLDGPLALVVGSEGGGMRSLVRASCDGLLRLPMRGRVASLNAAVAGSTALYLAWQARGFAGAEQPTGGANHSAESIDE